jgi:hypothetical protein
MKNKITLITPPDLFQNSSLSVLFVDISAKDQETISDWFYKNENEVDLNLYFYSADSDAQWLLSALNRCDLTFIDVDQLSPEPSLLLGYILSKPKVYFQCRQDESAKTLNLINTNQVPDVKYFLDEILNLRLVDK